MTILTMIWCLLAVCTVSLYLFALLILTEARQHAQVRRELYVAQLAADLALKNARSILTQEVNDYGLRD